MLDRCLRSAGHASKSASASSPTDAFLHMRSEICRTDVHRTTTDRVDVVFDRSHNNPVHLRVTQNRLNFARENKR
jgi:hypothetical protein